MFLLFNHATPNPSSEDRQAGRSCRELASGRWGVSGCLIGSGLSWFQAKQQSFGAESNFQNQKNSVRGLHFRAEPEGQSSRALLG